MSCFNLHSLIINGFERLVSIQVFPFVDCLFCPLSIFLLGFLFFLFFLAAPFYAACRILVFQTRIKPRPGHWKPRILTIRPLGNSPSCLSFWFAGVPCGDLLVRIEKYLLLACHFSVGFVHGIFYWMNILNLMHCFFDNLLLIWFFVSRDLLYLGIRICWSFKKIFLFLPIFHHLVFLFCFLRDFFKMLPSNPSIEF